MRDFDNFEVGASREVQFFGSRIEKIFGSGSEFKKRRNLMGRKGRVEDVGTTIAKALAVERLFNIIFYNVVFGRFILHRRRLLAEIGVVDFCNRDVHVNTVKERTRKLLLVVIDLDLSAGAFMCRVA